MRFSPSFLEEIKARLKVSEVVRSRVKLTREGREWRGLSPFTSEKTPSFFVNDQKGAWFDFSAGRNGNVFDFVMETEGLSFVEAVERLAGMAGLAMPKQTREAEAHEKARASLHEVLEQAASYYTATLTGSAGGRARAYLAGRGITPEIQARFRMGFALDEKYALRDHLAARGIPAETMIAAGLLVHGEGIAVPYDRFRDRIMFPICDPAGKVIAFGGRALAADARAKYLNSPETSLFHKGAVLYNHHDARKAAHETGRVIAVEGYIDVITMAAAGFAEVVAPMGTALTPDHCALLWRLAEVPILCFDGDRAGRKAAYRAIDLALPLLGSGRSLSFALLPEGQDPDELVRAEGPTAMASCLAAARPLADLAFLRETEAGPLATPEQKAGLERRLREIAKAIGDPILRRYYEAEFETRLRDLFGSGPRPYRSNFAKGPRDGSAQSRFRSRSQAIQNPGQIGTFPAGGTPFVSRSLRDSALLQPSRTGIPPREGLILLLVLNHPGLLERHAEMIAEVEFSNGEAEALRTLFLTLSATCEDTTSAILRDAAEAENLGAIMQKLDRLAGHASHWYAKPDAAEADAEEVLKQALTLHHRAKGLHRELQMAELALGMDSSEANLGRLNDIREQLTALGGAEASIEGFGNLSGRRGGNI
jgi:DNA primase